MKRINIKLAMVGAILALCLVFGGCVLPPLDGATTTPPAAPVASTTTPEPIIPTWTPPPATAVQGSLPSFADLVAQVRKAVVAVNTEVVSYDFFNRPTTQQGAGSGWIIDSNGIIVTNNHVIEGASSITVTLDDGRTFTAQSVHADPFTDLAVLKIDAAGLSTVSIGDASRLRVGDPVVAIGNPLGLGISAKPGWVSRLGVPLQISDTETLYDLIETDAPINPGNSGGALVSMSSQVIGITSAKISMVGVEGMGYAISINQAMPIIQQLIQKGYVVRPTIGLSGLYTVDAYVTLRYRLSVDAGAFVTQVDAGSPAEKAGIKVRDVITAFNDKPVTSADDLIQAVFAAAVGQPVKVTYYRGSAPNTVTMTTVESQPPTG
jgi:serine protease Do